MNDLNVFTAPSRNVPEVRDQQHYIAGAFRPAAEGGRFATLDPSTNEVIVEVAEGTATDVNAAVSSARAAFDRGPWPRMKASERAAVLRQIASLIRSNADDFIALECLDIGMPISQMRGLAARAAENFDFYARVVEDLSGRAFRVGEDFLNYTVHKPVGVAGLIMPWNAPLMLSSWRIAPCLAAGNTLVLKPAEWSPLTATRLAELLADSDLPDGVFNLVHGFGKTAGAPLAAHPDVDMLCFTGETTTGEKIMAAAAPSLKRLSMELGGKSPVVVFDDCDVDRAVDAVVFQVFSMNGQRCTAGSRLLVEESLYSRFVDRVSERASKIRVGDPFDPMTELGPLIRPEHHDRVRDFIASAVDQGATVRAGDNSPGTPGGGNFLSATVIADVDESMRVFREEIFGPVLTATPFADEADAIRLANATEYGLASYVWTSDIGRGHRVAQSVEAGLCWINSQNVRDLRTPFGGVKRSGIGLEGGHYSFDFYCQQEAIHVALGDHRIPQLGMTGT